MKNKEYVGYMKSKKHEDDLCVFVNEYPEGIFKWSFLDYKPNDIENYTPIYISLVSLKDTVDKIEKLEKANEILLKAVSFYADVNNWEDPITIKDPDFIAEKQLKEYDKLIDINKDRNENT